VIFKNNLFFSYALLSISMLRSLVFAHIVKWSPNFFMRLAMHLLLLR